MSNYRLISAHSHFVEPPNVWVERVDKRHRDRAPRTVKGLNGMEGEFFICQNIRPTAVAEFFGAGVLAHELPEFRKRGFESAPQSVWDPAYRIHDQDRDGVQAEVIYTSMGMPLFGLNDTELRSACFRAFNDWASEYCSYDPKRLIPLGLITLEDHSRGRRGTHPHRRQGDERRDAGKTRLWTTRMQYKLSHSAWYKKSVRYWYPRWNSNRKIVRFTF